MCVYYSDSVIDVFLFHAESSNYKNKLAVVPASYTSVKASFQFNKLFPWDPVNSCVTKVELPIKLPL